MGTIAIVGQRKPLDDRLGEQQADLFVLCGGAGSAAQRIYDAMEAAPESWDQWQHIFLIRDLGKLTGPEKQAWFGANASDRYVVLRGPDNPKRVARRGPVSELLTGGDPDILKIVDALLA
jgi:hypothetical protein